MIVKKCALPRRTFLRGAGAALALPLLYAMIPALTTAAVDTVDAPRETVRVVVREVPATHWAAGDVTIAERRAGQEPRP